MMLRRTFIGSLIAIPGLGFLKSYRPALYNDILGKALRCNVSVEADIERAYEEGIRWVQFPVTTNVTVEFEKGNITYTAFNITKETHKRLHDDPYNFIRDVTHFMNSNATTQDVLKYGIDTVIFNNQKFRVLNIAYTGTA